MTTTRPIQRGRPLRRPMMVLLGALLSLCAPLAVAQNNLGELLDAGAKILSPEDFKEQVVQRMLIAPTATGVTLELIYSPKGTVEGTGPSPSGLGVLRVGGEWTIDASGRVCTSMRMGGVPGGGVPGSVVLPPRCQWWLKLAEQYFLSDSDTDRHAKVLLRTIKK